MKTRLLSILTAVYFVAAALPLFGADMSKEHMQDMMKDKAMMQQMCTEMCKDPAMVKMMCDEMMKNPESMKIMCDEMMKNDKAKAMCKAMMK